MICTYPYSVTVYSVIKDGELCVTIFKTQENSFIRKIESKTPIGIDVYSPNENDCDLTLISFKPDGMDLAAVRQLYESMIYVQCGAYKTEVKDVIVEPEVKEVVNLVKRYLPPVPCTPNCIRELSYVHDKHVVQHGRAAVTKRESVKVIAKAGKYTWLATTDFALPRSAMITLQ